MSCVPQGALLALLAAILQCAITSPVWMPQFLSGGSGRNIRHLPCVSRRTGETGVCMFAFACMKANGTHLGTCIDRFYFGSCCRISEENVTSIPNTEDNNLFPIPTTTESKYYLSTFQSVQDNDNRVDVDDTPVKPIVIPSKKPSLPDKKPLTTPPTYSESPSTTSKPTTQTKPTKPTKPTTRKPITQTTTTRKPSTTKPTQTTTAKPTQTTTKKPVTQPKPTQTTTKKPVTQPKPTQTTTRKPVTQSKPPQTTTKKPVAQTKPTQTTTRKPVTQTKPTQTTTRKPVTQAKPTQTTTKKPVAQTKPTQTTTKKPVTQTKPTQTTTKKPVTQTTTRKPVTQSKPTQTTPIKPVTLSRPSATTTRKPVTQTKPTQTTTRKPVTQTKPTQTTTKKPVIQTKPTQTTTKGPVTQTKPHFTTTRPTTEYFTETTTRKLDIFTDYADNTLSTQPSSLLTTLLHTTGKPVFQTSTWKPFTTTSTRRPVTWSTTWKPDLTTWTSSVIKPKPPASVTTKKPVTIATKKPPVKTTTTTERPLETSTAPPASLVTWTLVQEPTKTEVTTASIDWILVPVTTHPPSGDTTQQAGTTTSSYPDTPTDASTAAITSTTSRPETTLAPEVTSSAATNISLDIDLNMTDFRQVCGRRLFPESRIVGGEKSSFGKWPWQISLRQWRTSTYLHKCGAALLNENWAITAAHCVENVPPSDLLLRLGEHDLSSEEEPYGYQERRVQIVASHPQFDPRTFEYDLALLRFYEPVTFQPNILPVCVPQDDTNFVGHTAYVTGWGRLYEDGPLPSVLQEVSVPVINNSVCETMYRSAGYIEHIPEIFICAGWRKGGFDSCEGDSGGPMVIQRPDKRWLLAGVISWGIGCAEPNQPGVYTRISEFREWINQILQF